jgi:hypothetical protein
MNVGQSDPRVQYLIRGAGATAALTDHGLVVQSRTASVSEAPLTMSLVGSAQVQPKAHEAHEAHEGVLRKSAASRLLLPRRTAAR